MSLTGFTWARIEPELYEKIREIAKTEERSIQKVITRTLRKALQ